jgi:hypothetical protein
VDLLCGGLHNLERHVAEGDALGRRPACVVVDPRRDVAEYLADAQAHGLTVVGEEVRLGSLPEPAGRAWTRALRVDHANHLWGLRLNDCTSLVVFTAAVAVLLLGRGAPTALLAAPPRWSPMSHEGRSGRPQRRNGGGS